MIFLNRIMQCTVFNVKTMMQWKTSIATNFGGISNPDPTQKSYSGPGFKLDHVND